MAFMFKQYGISNILDITKDVSLIKGDTYEELKKIPSNYIDLIVSSPPYNIEVNYSGNKKDDSKPFNEYLSWQESVIEQLCRICKDTGNIIWQTGNHVVDGQIYPLDIYFYPFFEKLGMQLRNRIIWHIGHGLHCSHRLSGRYETLLWFSKTKYYVFNLDSIRIPSLEPGKLKYKGPHKGELAGNPLGKNPSDYWEFMEKEFEEGIIDIPNVKSNHPEKTEHPCSYPIELAERCVLAYSNEGDLVLDPFGGSGSSVIASLLHNRKAIMIEREQTYIDITKDRILKLETGDLKRRKIGTPITKAKGKTTMVPTGWKNVAGTVY
jgi:DNA modification methylase